MALTAENSAMDLPDIAGVLMRMETKYQIKSEAIQTVKFPPNNFAKYFLSIRKYIFSVANAFRQKILCRIRR